MNVFSDEGAVFSTHTQRVHTGDPIRDNPRLLPSQAKKRFVEFIRAHHEGHIYKYRERLLHNYRKKKYMLTINLGDLANFDTKLKDLLQVRDHNVLQRFVSQNVVGLLHVRPPFCRNNQQSTLHNWNLRPKTCWRASNLTTIRPTSPCQGCKCAFRVTSTH